MNAKQPKIDLEIISEQLKHIEDQNIIILERIARIEQRQRDLEK